MSNSFLKQNYKFRWRSLVYRLNTDLQWYQMYVFIYLLLHAPMKGMFLWPICLGRHNDHLEMKYCWKVDRFLVNIKVKIENSLIFHYIFCSHCFYLNITLVIILNPTLDYHLMLYCQLENELHRITNIGHYLKLLLLI